MQRFYVCRHYLKWKGKLYKQGELLPESFTDHDRVRSIYSSRIARKEVPEQETSSQPPIASPKPIPPKPPTVPAPPKEVETSVETESEKALKEELLTSRTVATGGATKRSKAPQTNSSPTKTE